MSPCKGGNIFEPAASRPGETPGPGAPARPAPPDDREVAVAAAQAGAEAVRRWMGRGLSPEMKGRVDPVTVADREAEAVILETLAELRPGEAVLAEESGGRTEPEGRRWIIDPLDGTVNFVHGVPQVAVSVGLWDGPQPVAGAVVDVTRGEVFSAAVGEGARLGDQPIRVSDRSRLIDCLMATGFPYDRQRWAAEYTAAMGRVMTRVRDVRRMGAAALDFAWVACGRFDGFWEFGLHPWDAAAGLLLVTEAGGVTADLVSRPAGVDSGVFILSTPAVADEFIDLIRSLAPAHLRP